MNIETKKDKLCINQIIGQKTENVEVEGDAIIPDIKPDILKSINTSGNICIYKKEVLDGKVRIDGCINVNIIYLADNEEGNVRGLTTTIDFTKIIEMQEAKAGMMLECKMALNEIECKILNGRKVNLRNLVNVDLKLYSNEEVNFIEGVENVNDMQILNKNFNINSLVGSGSTKAIAKDTVVIDGIDNLAEIMKVNIDIVNIESKVSYNKVLAKADSEIKIMYLTDDNRVNTVECKIPVMGFIDILNVTDDNICDVKTELKNLVVKPNNVEEHSIYVEAEIELSIFVYQNKPLELIQDLYSPNMTLSTNVGRINTMQEKRLIKDVCNIREKQVINEIRNEKIYDVDIKPIIKKQNILNDRIIFEGELNVNFIYSNSQTSGIETKNIVIPFNHNMDCEGVNQNSRLDVKIEIGTKDIIVMPDESIELKIDLNLLVDIFKSVEINVINDMQVEENKDNEVYSIIIYFVKPGDTLWKIAKRFRSTVDNIARINGIEDENKISVGQQLFIPKYVANRNIVSA